MFKISISDSWKSMLIAIRPNQKTFTFICLILLYLFTYNNIVNATTEWHMVNCNPSTPQGDCHLLRDGNRYSLVDAGQPKYVQSELIPYLKNRSINTIENFFVSHPHTDHYGGILNIIYSGIRIKRIYYNLPPKEDWNFKLTEFNHVLHVAKVNGTELIQANTGDVIDMGSSTMTIIHAETEYRYEGKSLDINDYSMIMQWDAGGYRSLFTGDLNSIIGRALSKVDYVSADFLKVPHHGVTGIAPNEFFDKVNPKLLMNSAPRQLFAHYRGAQFKDWYERQSGKMLCSNGEHGTVVLRFYQSYYQVAPERSEAGVCWNRNVYDKPKEKINLKRALGISDEQLAALIAIYQTLLLTDEK